jgi:SAM-dependent methyltransferase
MTSPGPGRRPFYTEYAWAFDLLIDRPVRRESDAIAAWFVERGVRPGAAVLDAGCGTGRYAIELARRDYVVHGIDSSPELLDEANRSLAGTKVRASFEVGDISVLPASRYDAILCRGVLNDFVDDQGRESVFRAFGRALRPEGVLVFDVREWKTTVARKTREPVFRKTVATDRGMLTFTSVTELDPIGRTLIITERHTITSDGMEHSTDNRFVMRCWTREELDSVLSLSGFDSPTYFGAYDAAVAPGDSDRLVVITRLRRDEWGDRRNASRSQKDDTAHRTNAPEAARGDEPQS